ncbi:hypothetical protein L9F63_017065 [Diploptera punctata]|uniref:Chitin-binding type-4 domain-containing protein n=1 Tax=Diploptera punctata TaxID=6984 RepID=A0AAD8A0G4_DIPPU|nr:hypothetical protein L9F63_017065 [Diploptera punctata]
MAILCITVLFLVMVTVSHQHGMMMDPINRSSMWRLGFDNPPNYTDMGLYCGEIMQDWEENNWKCGLCGDAYSDPIPRANENTGYYGNGIIVAEYKAGSTITATIDLTQNHWGHFYFHLCPLASKTELETEECFEAHPVSIADGDPYYTLTSHDSGNYTIDLTLPAGLTCQQCVLRWTYVAANSWGTCINGTQDTGCGPQETFRSCSDITIS